MFSPPPTTATADADGVATTAATSASSLTPSTSKLPPGTVLPGEWQPPGVPPPAAGFVCLTC